MCCRQAEAGFISNYSKTKKCSESESAGEKIHEFAITIPVVLPDKDYPPATRQDLRLENCILTDFYASGVTFCHSSVLTQKGLFYTSFFFKRKFSVKCTVQHLRSFSVS